MKRVRIEIALLTLLAMALAPANAVAQTGKPKSPPSNQGDVPKPLEFGAKRPDFDMPATWPSPSPKPEGAPEAVAMALAKSVLDGGPNALPALERAALESGFAIRDENDAILFAPDPKSDLGLAVSDFELAAASFLTTRRDRDDLDAFNKVFADRPDLAGMDLKTLTIKSVHDFWASIHPGKRFWAAFVIALGTLSGGEFASGLIDSAPNTICCAQTVWLAYGAAGQMAAGAQPAPPRSELDTPAHGPRSTDPFGVAQGRVAAINNLARIVQHLGAEAIAKHIRQNLNQGVPPEVSMLEFVLNDLIKVGSWMSGSLSSSPLVRTKTLGQTGGQTNLDIKVDFWMSAPVRVRFAKACQQLGVRNPLPPNGPMDCGPLAANLESDLIHIANAPQWMSQTSAGRFRIVLRGNTQTAQYSNYAVPIAKEAAIVVAAMRPSGPQAGPTAQRFMIPIRDWKEPGIYAQFWVEAKGFGTEMLANGGSFYWSVNRYVSGQADLTRAMPVAYIPNQQGKLAPEFNRYISWLSNPLEPSVVIYQKIFDETVTRAILPGCDGVGVETTGSTTASRKREPQPRIYNMRNGGEATSVKFQLDHKNNLMTFALDLQRKVAVTQTDSKGRRLDFDKLLLSGIEFDADQMAQGKYRFPEGTLWDFQAVPQQNTGYPSGWTVYEVTLIFKAANADYDKDGVKSIDLRCTFRFIRTPNSSPSFSALSQNEMRQSIFALLKRL